MARRAFVSARVDSLGRIVLGTALAATVVAACAPATAPDMSGAERTGAVYPTVVAADGSAGSSAEPPGRDDHDHGASAVPPPPPARAVPVVAAFASAWVRSDLPAAAWWQGVAAYCDEGFARSLRTVDPSRVPATRLTGPPVAKQPPRGGRAVFEVPTDAGALTVRLAAVGGRWVVTDNDFRRAVSQ